MKKIVFTIFVAATMAGPAGAQGYHQNYGDSRVVRQNQTGLYNPSGTYIGPGTMSSSAKGNNGAAANPGLPSVTMGGTIRTPGDNLYNGSLGVRRDGNGSVIYQDYMQAQQQMKMMQQMRRQMQMQQQYAPQGNFYVPGSNGGVSSYGSSSSGGVQFKNGVYSYGK